MDDRDDGRDDRALPDMTTEMTWESGGEEYRLVRFTDLPSTRDGMVAFLANVMVCSLDEAAQAYDILFETDEFARSVQQDIDSLPVTEGA